MTRGRLVLSSARFYWRTHLGVLAGTAVAGAVLVGALVVGDSIRYTLRQLALSRIGDTHLALLGGDRFFRSALAEDLAEELGGVIAPVIQLSGMAAGENTRANDVQIVGVDERFWKLGGTKSLFAASGDSGVVVNERLASPLHVKTGDSVLLRIAKPSALPRDAPIGSEADASVAVRLPVTHVATDDEFGRFGLRANQAAPFNAFVPIGLLQKKVGLGDQANLLLIGKDVKVSKASNALKKRLQLEDLQLELRTLPDRDVIELRTERVFLDDAVVYAARASAPGATGVLTYFVNELRVGDRSTPYSMVSAIESLDAAGPTLPGGGAESRAAAALKGLRPPAQGCREAATLGHVPQTSHDPNGVAAFFGNRRDATPLGVFVASHLVTQGRHFVPTLGWRTLPRWGKGNPGVDMKGCCTAGAIATLAQLEIHLRAGELGDDEIIINTWLAEDLGAKRGDALEMRYFVLGERGGLVETSSTFTVRDIIPIEGPAADPTLMPEFPGLSGAENCRDWEPGVPIDLGKIRDKDEQYWDEHRGTPKAFVTFNAGWNMWANRFGGVTAVRYSAKSTSIEQIQSQLLTGVRPGNLGLSFQPVRERALNATSQALDFGQLFLGFSFFLIVAALLLTGLLFVLGIEQRSAEIGLLLAVGFRPGSVRWLLLGEGAVLAIIGAAIGTAAGSVYTRAVLYGLSTLWRDAVGTSSLRFHAEPLTLLIGFGATVVVSLLAMAWAMRRRLRRPARELHAFSTLGQADAGASRTRRPTLGLAVAGGAAIGAMLILPVALKDSDAAVGAFFGIGGLLLVGGIGASYAVIALLARSSEARRMTLIGLGTRNNARRPGRSLATVGLLACATFLIVAVGANRHDALAHADRRESGTGGFALIARSSLPIVRDLNTPAGRDAFGLSEDDMRDVKIVPFRVHEGDDASCLNLNRAQVPRVLGVDPEALASRGAFTFLRAGEGRPTKAGWKLLNRIATVGAVGDEATVKWALGKSAGDTVTYTDEHGIPLYVTIIATIANSILQGSIIISERDFIERFPSESGYKLFLIDAPKDRAAEVAKTLTRQLADVGFEVTPAVERLAAFNAVENTYLSIFQALGGLGLLLGCAGLGMVVLRNVLERRGELALLRAAGFARRSLRRLIFSEHWVLLVLGLACGTVAGWVAVLPAVMSPGADVPYLSLSLTLAAVLASGALWTWLAAVIALRGPLLPALRSE